MGILAHKGGVDEIAMLMLVPLLFWIFFRLGRGKEPPGDDPGAGEAAKPPPGEPDARR